MKILIIAIINNLNLDLEFKSLSLSLSLNVDLINQLSLKLSDNNDK